MIKSVSKSIEILRWCIDNNKTLHEGSIQFNVGENYVRKTKMHHGKKNESQVIDFLSLYDSFKNKSLNNISTDANEKLIELEKQLFEEDEKGNGKFEYVGVKQIKNLKEAVSFFKIDTNLWEVEKWSCGSNPVSARVREQNLSWIPHPQTGNSMMKGTAIRRDAWSTVIHYTVKVFLKKRIQVQQTFDFEGFYKDMLKKHKPPKYKKPSYKKYKEENLLEINLFDLHLGKLAWAEETGSNYNTKIACARFVDALEGLVARAQACDISKIVFVLGNDYFNVDTHTNTTTKGTFQSEDSRWQKTYRSGVKLAITAIDYLRQFAPVDVLMIPGNHDWTRTFFLGETLVHHYRNDESVTIDNRANPRKYYIFGNTLLGFTHGNNEKLNDLGNLMSHEARDLWSKTKYHEWHCGHWHRKVQKNFKPIDAVDEQLGIIVRHMASLSATDAWHHTMGYQGPIKAGEGFVWNKESGMIAHFNVNVEEGEYDDIK